MDNIQAVYFDALHKDRSDSADLLEKPSMRGIKSSVVEKYSDQAHFIYELLQNADDAHATVARFTLEPDRLIFAHNGTRLFSVSDPANEEADSASGTLGDINAITSIANSNKTEASIGKFGVGFKAVFQYTTTPYIYDPNFRFKIERFIVPTQLPGDFPTRRPGETLFVFPFDHPERDAKQSYADISDKILNLSFPLLFLTDLKEIRFNIGSNRGVYSKMIQRSYSLGDVTAERICLRRTTGEDCSVESLWLFSRKDQGNRRYSVGFFLNSEGKLRPVTVPAFCFFPTKEVTELHFIIHAPFLLTDSREGIRAGIPHNEVMVRLLAKLAAQAILDLKEIGERESLRLIDDGILKMIPYDPKKFSDLRDKSKISFYPFYDEILHIFRSEEILPSLRGYVSSENAYWAAVTPLTELFTHEQLPLICNNASAEWVFVSLGREETRRIDSQLCAFIDGIVKTNINEDAILKGRTRVHYYDYQLDKNQLLEGIKGIDASFIESQSIDWLHSFYKWLSQTKSRREAVLQRPVFLDQNGKAVAAFDETKHPILFLPVDNSTGYEFVHPALLENPETKKFLDEIGIDRPSLRDQIYNMILPQYKRKEPVDTIAHFKTFFDYFCDVCLKGEDAEFIDLIKGLPFLKYYSVGNPQLQNGTANSMYLPNDLLIEYFQTEPETRFIAIDEYSKLLGPSKEKQLMMFLTQLGVKKGIEIQQVSISYADALRRDLPQEYSTHGQEWTEGVIAGCKKLVDLIESTKDLQKSILLWNCLLSVIGENCTRYSSLSELLRGTYAYFYYTPRETHFSSSDEILLRQRPWLADKEGEFRNAGDITIATLCEQYDTSSDEAQDLIAFLGILEKEPTIESKEEANLTDEQRRKIELADRIESMGYEEGDFEELQRIKQRREAKRQTPPRRENRMSSDSPSDESESEIDEILSEYEAADEDQTEGEAHPSGRLRKAASRVFRDIVRHTLETPPADSPDPAESSDAEEAGEVDQDDYIPAPYDTARIIERAKKKSADEIGEITRIEELRDQVLSLPKYSFGWFQRLLELESLHSGKSNSNSREVSISFSKVEREPGTERTLVLQQPNRFIPQFMEDLADIPLVLHMGNTKKTLAIEVSNIKSYSLRVKLKSGVDMKGVDPEAVDAATIDVKSPAFLLEELRKQFGKLDYADDFDMQKNLRENIEFIFGPPGTGKTTYLAENVILPLMAGEGNCKVLVLTPTNKAADVLVRRIMGVSGNGRDYEDWLIRFGTTGDENIEQSPVFRDKTLDIRKFAKNVTVTTIARFPYDFFMPGGAHIYLEEIDWDYIIVDEASMIPIANIVYLLYKKNPQKFIIAGDPFQIEPIASVDLWKDENIYTLVHLDSFTEPRTVPHPYRVELLTTQYRSIPEIGNIFSHFAYGGILKHARPSGSRKPLHLPDRMQIQALNIIKFPVSKYESIYRAKKLRRSSSYQIYSALLVYEYVCALSGEIAIANPGSLHTIGVISPYRAQADLIDKLISAEKLPPEVEVQVGTIHGFQGDECDILFAVFNTPPSISTSKNLFLNKRNILNVSISRARDYLFLVMPDDATENIEKLQLVKRVEQLMKGGNACAESYSHNLEHLLFSDAYYLEKNAFSTGHQSVNVYGLPEKRYEVRTEDNAVDVQIDRGGEDTSPEVVDRAATAGLPTDKGQDDANKAPGATKAAGALAAYWRKNGLEIRVRGKMAGKYLLIPYTGKLKKYTDRKVTAMFIPQTRAGKENFVPVSIIEDEKLIFIPKDAFDTYKKSLSDPSAAIELRKAP